MPVLQFKGKTAVENYHHTVPHHRLEFDAKLSLLGKGEKLPAYEDIAKYVFYTETSREFPGTTKKQNPAWDKKAGRIGEHAGRSYYLLYEPNERDDRGLDRAFLNDIASQDPNHELIVYCERLSVHQDELRKFYREHGKRIRHMLVPFNLK